MDDLLHIRSTTYEKNSTGVFEVSWGDLDGLRFAEVPYYSTVEVADLPGEPATYQLQASATHGGGPGNEDFMVFVNVTFSWDAEPLDPAAHRVCDRRFRHIRRTFRPLVDAGILADGEGENADRRYFSGAWFCQMLYSATFTRADNPMLAEFLAPVVERFGSLLTTPDQLLFLCHAAEDKEFVDALALFLDSQGLEHWYDKREIKAGDSIITRVSAGLDAATHLVIVLSRASVQKPWVQRELSSALMNQLKDASITVIPILREPCSIPLLLSDIRYVDCSSDRDRGLQELVHALA
jgi:hypothetical protein